MSSVEEKSFLAKPDKSIRQHTDEVIACFQSILNYYQSHFTEQEIELIHLACEYHDYGKLNDLFQEKIYQGHYTIEGEIPHNFLSPLLLDQKKLEEKYGSAAFSALYTAIYYSHIRDDVGLNATQLYDYFCKHLQKNASLFLGKEVTWQYGLMACKISFFKYDFKTETNLEKWLQYALIAGMLVRCDRAASAGILELELNPKVNGNSVSEITLKTLSNLYDTQQFMLNHQQDNVILVSPTGTGKTEASLLWLGEDKGFYTLPLQVAVNAIYQRILNSNYSHVGLLHSNAVDYLVESSFVNNDYAETKKETFQWCFEQYERTKFFQYPLTICTIDQLFKFPFKSLGYESALATLSYSKVIIDEIQMYSSTIVACIITGLKLLMMLGGKFALTTATMPAFLKDLFAQYLGQENYQFYQSTLELPLRHVVQVCDDVDLNLLLEQSREKKVLIICNTVAKAQEWYRLLKEMNDDVFLLHARFIKKDRDQLEEQIIDFSKNGTNGIWITTQIVEASLDIDFDILHTEMAPIDNLIQRFGRCYRKREYGKIEPNVFIYNTCNGIEGKHPIYDPDLYQFTVEALLEFSKGNAVVLSEADKSLLLDQVYNTKRVENTKYAKEITEKIQMIENIYAMSVEKEAVEKRFREIDSILILPECVYNDNQDLLNQYKQILTSDISYKEKQEAKYEILKYSVSVPRYIQKMYSVDKEPFVNGIYRARLRYEFDAEKIGLVYEDVYDSII